VQVHHRPEGEECGLIFCAELIWSQWWWFDGVYCQLIIFVPCGCGWREVIKLGSWWISHFGIPRLVDYWKMIYRYEWRQWSKLGGSVTIESGVGTEVTDLGIWVQLVFRPPMQVLLKSVVACD
jgi:hypothetical protein